MVKAMKEILNDFIAEQSQVDTLVDGLTEDEWLTGMEYCAPWNIKDAIIHITFYDYAANKLMADEADDLVQLANAEADLDETWRARAFWNMSGKEVLGWWREERTKLDFAFMHKDPKERVPWAPGLPMSAKSLCSARLMELWAHSVDIYDALGKDVVVCERITSVLFLSWQARKFAYTINELQVPDTPMYLQLTLPSGAVWTKGELNPDNYIKGSAKEWALVSVRRRNWMDTALEVVGSEARRYASIVQCYAGTADPAPKAKNPR